MEKWKGWTETVELDSICVVEMLFFACQSILNDKIETINWKYRITLDGHKMPVANTHLQWDCIYMQLVVSIWHLFYGCILLLSY